MADRFAKLDRSVPLALLPVRLQARFKGPKLLVRILPDQIHADAHSKELTELERDAGQMYWMQLWKTKGDDVAETTRARDRLGALVGARRALFVAGQTRPLNWGDFGAVPAFPKLVPIKASPPINAALLPDFWICRLYDPSFNLILAQRTPNPVAKGLRMAPTLAQGDPATQSGDHVLDFLWQQNLHWMVDFPAAVEAGMALEIDLPDDLLRIGAVVVAGVRAGRDPLAEAEALDAQFASHWFSSGFDILAQGTPTNNTAAGPAPYTETLPDMDALFLQDQQRRPLAATARAAVLKVDPSMLLRVPVADTAALALGMTFESILDRCPAAEAPEALGGWVMNACIGQGLANYFTGTVFTQWGGGAPFAGAFDDFAEHYVNWVRAAGPLPSVRLGPQPYGLLPVAGALKHLAPTEAESGLIAAIQALFPEWKASFPLPTLDPEATDGEPSSDPQQTPTTLLEVLGAVPHPTNLHLRRLVNHIADDADILAAILQDLDDAANNDPVPINAFLPDIVFFFDLWAPFRARIDGVSTAVSPNPTAPDIAEQIAIVEELIDTINEYAQSHIRDPMLEIIETRLLSLLAIYQEATDAIPALLQSYSEDGGLSRKPPEVRKPDDLLNFTGSTYADLVPISETVTQAGSLDPLRELVEKAIASLEQPAAVGARDRLLDGPAPLLSILIERTYLLAPIADAPRLRLALQLLAARLSDETIDPVSEIDRLMRGTLGLFMNRLDAWITSFATQSLARMRQKTPRGIGIGGFGWLLDLSPTTAAVSDGFLHAASMTQASTAALLRSGWKGYGTAEGSAPLSVDLTSKRVRGAEWVLDGVRNGQDLAETLGARFERSLHDAGLDRWIDDVRGVVNTASGRPDPRMGLVDGLLLARAGAAERSPDEQALRDALLTLSDPAVGTAAQRAEKRRLRQAFARLADDLDAVADVMMLESIFALAQGNSAAAAAALNFTGDAEGAVPEITAPQTPGGGQLVTHRIVALWDGTSPPVAPSAILAAAEPRLAAWLGGLLPDPARVRARVLSGPAGRQTVLGTLSLADLGLDPAEAMALAGRSVTQADTPLGRLLLAAALARFAPTDPNALVLDLGAAGGDGWTPVDTFGLLAATAQEAIAEARPLAPADVVSPGGTVAALWDSGDLAKRIAEVSARLTAAAAVLGDAGPTLRRQTAGRLAALRVPGAIGLAEAPEDTALLAAVQTALAARIALGSAATPAPEQRLHQMIGAVLPVLPLFVPDDAATLQASAQDPRRAADVASGGDRWLRQARRVNRTTGYIADFLDLAEALNPDKAPTCGVIQLPPHPEGWAAITLPDADRRDRLCLFTLTGPAALARGGPVAGLVFDGWVEAIPAAERQTGLAFHFDAPSARAPQTILLSLLDHPKAAFEDQVFDQLVTTIAAMKMRALGPDRHRTLGHYLPVTYLPGDVALSEAPE